MAIQSGPLQRLLFHLQRIQLLRYVTGRQTTAHHRPIRSIACLDLIIDPLGQLLEKLVHFRTDHGHGQLNPLLQRRLQRNLLAPSPDELELSDLEHVLVGLTVQQIVRLMDQFDHQLDQVVVVVTKEALLSLRRGQGAAPLLFQRPESTKCLNRRMPTSSTG